MPKTSDAHQPSRSWFRVTSAVTWQICHVGWTGALARSLSRTVARPEERPGGAAHQATAEQRLQATESPPQVPQHFPDPSGHVCLLAERDRRPPAYGPFSIRTESTFF